jgi:hypothetical protein
MQTNIQATWKTGQEVVVDVVLTAHHKVCSLSWMLSLRGAVNNSITEK